MGNEGRANMVTSHRKGLRARRTPSFAVDVPHPDVLPWAVLQVNAETLSEPVAHTGS